MAHPAAGMDGFEDSILVLNISDLDKKVFAFITAYYDIWADGVITNIERRKFQFLGKGLRMLESTVEKLLEKRID